MQQNMGVLQKMGDFVISEARGNGCREKSRGTTGESGKVFNIELITGFIIKLFVLTFSNAIRLHELCSK